MSHLFITDIPIHRKYDMKGSKEGRVVSEEERAQPGFTLRDYDFEAEEGTIDVGPEVTATAARTAPLTARTGVLPGGCGVQGPT